MKFKEGDILFREAPENIYPRGFAIRTVIRGGRSIRDWDDGCKWTINSLIDYVLLERDHAIRIHLGLEDPPKSK